jgi:CHASE2 domain-containing sensor protein
VLKGKNSPFIIIALSLLISLGFTYLHSLNWFQDEVNEITQASLAVDRFLVKTHQAQNIVVVQITEEEFKRSLQSHYSGYIDRQYVARIVEKLVYYSPSIIALDFDLSVPGENAQELNRILETILDTSGTKIILTSQIAGIEFNSEKSTEIIPPYCKDLHQNLRYGFSQIDDSGSDRIFLKTIDQNGLLHLSFAATILAAVDDKLLLPFVDKHLDRSPDMRIRYFPSGRYKTWTSSAVLEEKNLDCIRDNIVLVGGSYTMGMDLHLTPAGVKSGAELQANILDNLLHKTYLVEPSLSIIFIIQFVFGCFIGLLFLRYKFKLSVKILSVLGVVILITVSWWLFHSIAYWITAIPTAVITGTVAKRKLQNKSNAG